jgi:hypothetical protein
MAINHLICRGSRAVTNKLRGEDTRGEAAYSGLQTSGERPLANTFVTIHAVKARARTKKLAKGGRGSTCGEAAYRINCKYSGEKV